MWIYTRYTISKAKGAILLQYYFIIAPKTTGGTWTCRKRSTVSPQWQGAALLGKGSQEPRVMQGPHWQGCRAGLLVAVKSPSSQMMRQVQGQACQLSGCRSTGMAVAAAQLQWSFSWEQGWEPQFETSSWVKEQQVLTEVSSGIFFQGYQLYYLYTGPEPRKPHT